MCELTIVIPTWNQSELLRNCLKSVLHQTKPCRVLVVDNASTDSTETMLTTEGNAFQGKLQHLRLGRNEGFSRAVNEGIRVASTDCIALLNNDTEADAGWIESGLHALAEFPEYSFFASRIVNFQDRNLLDSAGDCYDKKGIAYKRGHGANTKRFCLMEEVPGASAAAAFYRRSLFEQVGLFDEDLFMYLEDVDLSLRAQLQGHRCLYLPDAIVYHIEAASDPDGGRQPAQQSSNETLTGRRRSNRLRAVSSDLGIGSNDSPGRVYWITRNRWQLMITYQPLRHLPWLLYGWLRSLVSHLASGRRFWPFLRGVAAGVLQTRLAIRKRRRLRHNRILSMDQFGGMLRRYTR